MVCNIVTILAIVRYDAINFRLAMINTTSLKSLKKIYSGKVRDIYEIDESRLMLVATDRLSAFDVVFDEAVPKKGQILTALSSFWFDWLSRKMPHLQHHMLDTPPESLVSADERDIVVGRSVVVRRTRPLPIEAVVRGYLAGSAWKSYQIDGTICGIVLPRGLAQSSVLPSPVFTPATKAPLGDHDENISWTKMAEMLGKPLAEQVREQSINIYQLASAYARERGIIIADTKFEFGLAKNSQGGDELLLIDEALTPDSSRYWTVGEYREGISPPSFDKQFVRDYLLGLGWNQNPPPPPLPAAIVNGLAEKYQQVLHLLRD
jgi:phosphoribosylaminoimidazole-succinocarboxamide synthase